MLSSKHGGDMDYGYALNYWRQALRANGGDADLLDKLQQEISSGADAMLISFISMLEACSRGKFQNA